MATSVILKLVCVMVASMVMTTPHVEAAVTCNVVASNLIACITYLKSGGAVPSTCCSGIKSLNAAATTTSDRQTACQCLKQLATSISGLKTGPTSTLPAKCGVSVGYPISASVDCSK
ncbi:hypothetical protein AQUCO_02700329v1 [Aquilegia coerulea]|nr:hypothetical protein AQUCO_02700329v1 [Aquilegia coerulea]